MIGATEASKVDKPPGQPASSFMVELLPRLLVSAEDPIVETAETGPKSPPHFGSKILITKFNHLRAAII